MMIKHLTALTLAVSPFAAAQSVTGGYLWSSKGIKPTIIAGDGIPDPISIIPFRVKGTSFTFVITDSEGTILAYTSDNNVDLEGAGEGTCRVYGFTYEGDFDFPVGGNVKDLTASGESALSRNNISIKRVLAETTDGGYVRNDRSGSRRLRLNLERDARPFRVYSLNKAASETSYAFIITDNEGNVLGFPPANVIDLSGAPPGICRVYGISYTGELDTTTGVSIGEVTSSDGNQSLSRNWVTAVRR